MYRSVFSYYGSKSKIAQCYPHPKYDTIIEPFCGGASYSLRYYERSIRLNDLDPITAEIWRFLLSPSAEDTVENDVPTSVAAGQKVDEMTTNVGLRYIFRAEANNGTQGAHGNFTQVTSFGAANWHRLKPRLLFWIPKIRHWIFSSVDYQQIPQECATWFVDPPYNNPAGKRYRTNNINYQELSCWSRKLPGQTIVCENAGAAWLPFRPLVERRGIRSRYQQSRAMEVIWTNG